jgi:hypothetical protein
VFLAQHNNPTTTTITITIIFTIGIDIVIVIIFIAFYVCFLLFLRRVLGFHFIFIASRIPLYVIEYVTSGSL